MTDNRVYAAKHAEKSGTLIYIAINRNYAGYILVNDEERPDSIVAVSGMTARGIQTVMLTGDSTDSAERIAAHLGISKTHAELLPYDKVTGMEGIMKRRKKPCAFVGDGLNDAPAIALADVGVAMGITGSAGAIDAADVILMTDEPSKLLKAIDISRKTMRVVKQNTIAVTAIKLIIAVLAVFGIVGIWSAVFIEAVAAIVCLLRPLKLLKR
jgi:Cd2+/Zn2+-exporting ATPase